MQQDSTNLRNYLIELIHKKLQLQFTSLQLEKLSSLTNDVYKVSLFKGDELMLHLIYKRYRDQLLDFINRQIEAFIITELANNKQYPKIYLISERERVQEFLEGEELKVDTASYMILQQFVVKLARFSKKYTPIYRQVCSKEQEGRTIASLWTKFQAIFLKMSKEQSQITQKCQQQIQKILKTQVLYTLQKHLPQQMMLSHNDSNLTNILMKKDKSLQILDFQFTSLNYIGFDLGNFFNQYATQYHQGFQIREEWEISQNQKQKLIELYFQELGGDKVVNEKSVVQYGRMLSHLFWMFVGLRQIGDQDIGLDMVYYVNKRAEEFQKCYTNLTGAKL